MLSPYTVILLCCSDDGSHRKGPDSSIARFPGGKSSSVHGPKGWGPGVFQNSKYINKRNKIKLNGLIKRSENIKYTYNDPRKININFVTKNRCHNIGQSSKKNRKRYDSVMWQKPLYQQTIQQPIDNTKTPPKISITQRLPTDLRLSVGVTTAIQLIEEKKKKYFDVPLSPLDKRTSL